MKDSRSPDFAELFRGFFVSVKAELARMSEDPPEPSKRDNTRRTPKPKGISPRSFRYGRYDPKTTPDRAEAIAAKGVSTYAIARDLEIDETTLTLWCKAFPRLSKAIDRGRNQFFEDSPCLQRPPCPRCGGFVDLAIEYVEESSMERFIPRCRVCGKRYYRGVTVIAPRKKRKAQK